MSKALRKYKARIFGDIYTIVSDEEDEFVVHVVHKVDSLMKEIAARHSIDSKKVAVLAALKLAEEYLSLQQDIQQEHAHLEKILSFLDTQKITM